MSFRNNRLNKSVSPLGERNITPDCNSKYTNGETIGESNINGPSLKEFTESPGSAYYFNRGKSTNREDQFLHFSLAQINLELDNNMNEVIYLLSRRKMLASTKLRKMREDMQDKIQKAKHRNDSSNFEYLDDEQFSKIVQFCPNSRLAIKILSKIINLLPQLRGPRGDEEEKSESFWIKNKQLQNQMDSMLEKLKSIDKNLQKQNHEVNDICKSLDHIEDSLKAIAGNKSEDHLEKVEPLFKSKKKNYDSLNGKVKERERIKDLKIEYIKRIRDALNHLKITRENRLNQIAQFFGFDNNEDIENLNFKNAGDFTSGFEELLKLREKEGYLELEEHNTLRDIENLAIDQEHLYNQLLRKQSDEAKAYHNYSKIMFQKIKYVSFLSLFGSEQSHHQILSLNPTEISKKFKEYKNFLKRFMEEDSLIKQGLLKTNETWETFGTVLRATENEKQRRHELLSLLETCIRKRGDYEHKKEDMRNLMVQITKNQQEMAQYEEELEMILSDGDLEGYKKIGNLISKCESEKRKLMALKEKIERDMDSMDREVVGLATRIQDDYQDILCQIVPSDIEYSLKNGEDVKRLRNHLRKMYKRLGILNSQ